MINSSRVLVFAMLSTASGWGLPSQDSPKFNESTDITGGVDDGARDRRQLRDVSLHCWNARRFNDQTSKICCLDDWSVPTPRLSSPPTALLRA